MNDFQNFLQRAAGPETIEISEHQELPLEFPPPAVAGDLLAGEHQKTFICAFFRQLPEGVIGPADAVLRQRDAVQPGFPRLPQQRSGLDVAAAGVAVRVDVQVHFQSSFPLRFQIFANDFVHFTVSLTLF